MGSVKFAYMTEQNKSVGLEEKKGVVGVEEFIRLTFRGAIEELSAMFIEKDPNRVLARKERIIGILEDLEEIVQDYPNVFGCSTKGGEEKLVQQGNPRKRG